MKRSRRNATAPSPPFPASTRNRHSSTKCMGPGLQHVRREGGKGRFRTGMAGSALTERDEPLPRAGGAVLEARMSPVETVAGSSSEAVALVPRQSLPERIAVVVNGNAKNVTAEVISTL